jgi:ABC-2 type transport system ATP-binding protein
MAGKSETAALNEHQKENRDAVIVENVVKRFGSFTALDDVSFSIGEGEIFGLLGHNGAGKSTLINIISLISKPTSGVVSVFGKKDRSLIGLAPQENAVYADLTCLENVVHFARLYGIKNPVIVAVHLLSVLGLDGKAEARARDLSGGMRRRLNLACSMVYSPKLLILDEPTTGLDPIARRALWKTIRDLQTEGITILLTTHYMEEAEYLCDRIAILDSGRLVDVDTPLRLKRKTLHSLVTVELSRVPTGAELKRLSVHPEDKVLQSGKIITIECNEPERVIPLASKVFGEKITKINVNNPTLEDLFMKMAEVKR